MNLYTEGRGKEGSELVHGRKGNQVGSELVQGRKGNKEGSELVH